MRTQAGFATNLGPDCIVNVKRQYLNKNNNQLAMKMMNSLYIMQKNDKIINETFKAMIGWESELIAEIKLCSRCIS